MNDMLGSTGSTGSVDDIKYNQNIRYMFKFIMNTFNRP